MESRERTTLLKQAFSVTQRFYDKFPPQRDLFPLFEAASAWPIVCGAFMGIETTMKHLLILAGNDYPKGRAGHDILKLYEALTDSQRGIIGTYFNVYRSLHFDTVAPAIHAEELQSADSFIRSIAKEGSGYQGWRYMFIEDPQEAPRVHIGLMLEIWRALVHIPSKIYEPLDRRLSNYMKGLVRHAADSVRWQNAAGEGSVEFREVYDWFTDNGGYLTAGIILFDALNKDQEALPGASGPCAKVLLNAAMEASKQASNDDINAFLQCIRGPGLSWDAESRLFKRP